MPELELWLLVLTFTGLFLGIWGILWSRAGLGGARISWGNGLFVCAILSLGFSSLVAAFHRAEGLIPLGLSAGLLVVGMLWEGPFPSYSDTQGLDT